MSKEAEKEEKRKEELEADPLAPNKAATTAKETEKTAGAEMEATIKEAVDKNSAELKSAVDKQKASAASAKAKSNVPESKSHHEGTGFSDDEKWTANMPVDGSFIAKKVQTAIKK